MKTYIHEFKKYGPPSQCRVYILEKEGYTWVGFENMGTGLSVTNASELLASQIVDKENLDPEKCRFFEWYSEYEGDVDQVFYHWDDRKASEVHWRYFCDAKNNPFIGHIQEIF